MFNTGSNLKTKLKQAVIHQNTIILMHTKYFASFFVPTFRTCRNSRQVKSLSGSLYHQIHYFPDSFTNSDRSFMIVFNS
jgi:hypothetical protein